MTAQNQSQEVPLQPQQNETTGAFSGNDSLLEFDASDPSAEQQLGKIIKVIAIGGQGGNAGNYIHRKKLPYVEVMAFNTDQQDLNKLDIERKVVIGRKITHYGGAGRKPENGMNAMKEDLDQLDKFLVEGEDADDPTRTRFAFVLAGLGGGTGSGAAPVAVECCKKHGYTTIAVVTMPPRLHGESAMRIAKGAVAEIEKHADKVLFIDNHKIYKNLVNVEKRKAFDMVDSKVADAVESFVNIIRCVPRINIDPNDIRTILTGDESKIVIIGTGFGKHQADGTSAEGNGEAPYARVSQAIDNAINSPILMYNSVLGASSMLTHHLINPGDEFSTDEERMMIALLKAKTRKNTEFLDGGGEDESVEKGSLQLTIIATGFPEELTPSLLVEKLLSKEKHEVVAISEEVHNPEEDLLDEILREVTAGAVATSPESSSSAPEAKPIVTYMEQPARTAELQGEKSLRTAAKENVATRTRNTRSMPMMNEEEDLFANVPMSPASAAAPAPRVPQPPSNATESSELSTPAYLRLRNND